MEEIYIKDAKKITVEYLKENLTKEQKEILIGSKFNYDDIINEIKLMCVIFNGNDDIVINVAEIFENIKKLRGKFYGKYRRNYKIKAFCKKFYRSKNRRKCFTFFKTNY